MVKRISSVERVDGKILVSYDGWQKDGWFINGLKKIFDSLEEFFNWTKENLR